MKCCKLVQLSEIVDHRGALMFAEDDRHIPFVIKRIFSIYGVPPGSKRGAHAHRENHQFIILLNGTCRLLIDEGVEVEELLLHHPTKGLYVPPLVWVELRDFSEGAVCLVLSSAHYEDADYIRDYKEFRAIVATSSI